VVHIPEGMIEQFDLVPICLIHEAFHVITKCERQRKRRAKCLMLHMIEYMEDFLFREVEFDADEDTKIKKRLMTYWFRNGITWLEDIASREEEDRCFYGKQIKSEIKDLIINCIVHINDDLEEKMAKVMFDGAGKENYFQFHQRLQKKDFIISKIRNNIFDIIIGNKVSAVANLLMFMYRETYADLACILTLELTPGQYRNAFSKSIRFKYDGKNYYDMNREIRERLVMKAVSQFLPEKQKKEWEEGLKEIISEKCLESIESNRQNDGNYDKLVLYRDDMEIFEDYLLECGKRISKRLGDIVNVEVFRRSLKDILNNQSQEDLLFRILAGDIVNKMGGAQNANGE